MSDWRDESAPLLSLLLILTRQRSVLADMHLPPAGGFTASSAKTQKDAIGGGGSKASVTSLSSALLRYADLQKQRDLAEASGFKLKATVKAMVLGDETARTLVRARMRFSCRCRRS